MESGTLRNQGTDEPPPMAATSIDMPTTATSELLTADGRPLKESLQRSLRRRKLTALALVAPAVVFPVRALRHCRSST